MLCSVIIPVRNGASTLARCLRSVCASPAPGFEVIVVDDASSDSTAQIARRFPCRLLQLGTRRGAAGARNAGAAIARGELLFFTDADCVLRADTLDLAARALARAGPGTAMGGTYTPHPVDDTFYSRFQSAFIHYSETKRSAAPDYLATHALAIRAREFRAQGGFAEGSLPILEDVEFSHRLRRAGLRLRIDPGIQVGHVFGFGLRRSLLNAFVKSMHWTQYSLRNGDLLTDSGTASHELKANTAAYCVLLLCLCGYLLTGAGGWLGAALAATAGNLFVSRGLLRSLRAAGGARFAAAAALYYLLVYPLAVGAGAAGGAARYLATSARRGAAR
ncbi:MAG: glycosyltransferase family 2 protein [Betaproteobacteria bacterium]|nr:glycosyltransferase family 2 protein [Betaproteobacteria bacterium]